MELKVINEFIDKKENVHRYKGEIFECDEKRHKEIVDYENKNNKKLVEVVEIADVPEDKTENAAEDKPAESKKKKTAKAGDE
ncbi:MAG: hypothetical protein NC397_09295 [Clostridium sp.]|nr:hypothetical protein [Clostridium sp.]